MPPSQARAGGAKRCNDSDEGAFHTRKSAASAACSGGSSLFAFYGATKRWAEAVAGKAGSAAASASASATASTPVRACNVFMATAN